MRILIRSDGDASIGTGHLMRCLALAQVGVDAGDSVVLASAVIPDPLCQRYQDEGVVTHRILAPRASSEDARETLSLARELSSDWLIIDGYAFDAEYQSSARLEVQTLVVDDLQHLSRYAADIILNQNLGVESTGYAGLHDDTRLLLGPRYALLRREYAPWRNWARREAPRRLRLLVTLGGSDPEDVTCRVLEALRGPAPRFEMATVLVGASNPHRRAIETAAGRLDLPIDVKANTSDMPEVLANADLAISAAGSTCWELAFMGLPSVLIAIAGNQRGIADALHREGVAFSVGWHGDCDPLRIRDAMGQLADSPETRRRMSRRGRELVDGLGAERVYSAMVAASQGDDRCGSSAS